RAREVTVPRLPERRDEIGMLARALSDMSHALRQRIDATDAFAADVSHELKNPIASLRSALDSLERVDRPDLRAQLMAIAQDDVRRLDRLVTDIAEASRVDAELSRTRFEPIDLGLLIEKMVIAREVRGVPRGVRLAFARPRKGVAVVLGEEGRLVRVLDNLIDNAVSFSPDKGLVRIIATVADDQVLVSVEDEGPGVPEPEREHIFRRFHSVRPEGEAFGKHSGLGLAIARSIVEGHQGRISIGDREDAQRGASFVVRLPMAVARDPGIVSE
ncbi:MAG: HAMP domain-containing sensor histidine kinase, partial [Pseudomonadota bacterium]